ncbi:serine hydrolase FSH [Nemania sp. FL0916]|nr:serine hydrolase FSH [Nemania sp. FL0916]
MKILCLDGADQPLRTRLGPTIEVVEGSEAGVSFDFVVAPTQCSKSSSEGLATHKTFDVADIDKGHDWLTAKLDVDGPYDGVIGFGNGASLASSYLLYHQWYNHENGPPFRFATFISGSISLAVLRSLGVPVPRAAERVVEEVELRRQEDLGPLPSHVSLARQSMFNSDNCFGLNLNMVPAELKIRMPTAHVWGRNDPGFPTSIHLAGLCDPYIRQIYIHGDGDEVPQGSEDTQQLSQLILWCMQRAIWPGCSRAQ